MQPLAQIATLVIQTLASLYLFFVVMRFMLQLARADFYNPLSQAVVKVTNPVLLPLRKVVPGFFGVDMASVLLGLIVAWLAIEINALFVIGTLFNPVIALAWAAIGLVSLVAYIIFAALIVTIIVSWVAPYSSHPALSLLHQLMEPVRVPFSRLIPPMGGLDISPIFIFLSLQVVRILLDSLAAWLGLGPLQAQFVPGY